ncbi:class I SAM-dependent methyltransferase [Bacteroidota bacterium]
MKNIKSAIRFSVFIPAILFLITISVKCQPKYGWDHDKILDLIGLKEGMKVGEAGAGDGYLTFYLSERVGKNGKVYANDISNRALRSIRNKCETENINNIETVMGDIDDPLFPDKSLDLVVMVHSFHDFTQPVKWLENVKVYLKKDAKLVIIDRDSERCTINYDMNHFYTEKHMLSLIKKGGFKLVRLDNHLPQDNIYICSTE